jgi:sigma-B regulation protein RsbU (phosphoserine phosphatase)
LSSLLALANQAIFEDTEGTRWVTLFFALLDPQARTIVHAAAGHEGYVLTHVGAVKRMEGTGPPIGMIGDSVYSCGQPVTLASGDVLILLTDGFLEAQAPAGNWFGIQRVLTTIADNRHRTALEILDALFREVHRFCDPRSPQDDLTAVIVRVE